MPKLSRTSKLKRDARRLATSTPLTSAASLKEAKKESTSSHLPASEQQSDASHQKHAKKGDVGAVKESSSPPSTQELSRGQRKRQAKREAFLRKEKLILSSLKLKSQEEQKKRIDGLDAIRDALLETAKNHVDGNNDGAEEEEQQASSTTNKSKKKLLVKEVDHLNLVVQHPAYQADPFKTMQEHLKNTFAKQKERNEKHSKERSIVEKKRNEEKKRAKKEEIKGRKKTVKKFKAGRRSRSRV